jgi:spore maturation protein CgeB
MKIVIFGLSVSSSWGNGHATLWRGLCRELAYRGHQIVFFEKDVPYYALHRDLTELAGGLLYLYSDWFSILPDAHQHLNDADAAIITSYCPDALPATDLVLDSRVSLRVFYDLDTPVTLHCLRSGRSVPYIKPEGLGEFECVLSYTGGLALRELQSNLGARKVAPLFGSVDPWFHRRVLSYPDYVSDLSYLGTYSDDRQEGLNMMFIEAARSAPDKRFVLGGSMYPPDFPWLPNIYYFAHVAPYKHPAFYSSSRLTLNVTRGPMAQMGYCASGRLFEAAACGTPILTDTWQGLDAFFTPGEEVIVVRSTEEVLDAMAMPDEELQRIGNAGRERALSCHTAAHRAIELETLLEQRGGLHVGSDPGRGVGQQDSTACIF